MQKKQCLNNTNHKSIKYSRKFKTTFKPLFSNKSKAAKTQPPQNNQRQQEDITCFEQVFQKSEENTEIKNEICCFEGKTSNAST